MWFIKNSFLSFINKHLLITTTFLITIHWSSLDNIYGSPLIEIPEALYRDYTLNGKIPVLHWYWDDSYSDNNPLIYDKNTIDSYIDKARQRKTNYYGSTDLYLYQALEQYTDHIKGKSVAILGSTTPWYESIIIAYEGLPTTIEYNKLVSQDPRLKVMTVAEYNENPQTFDVLLSISSFEHDGLGRYGDPLDPEGDLKAMQKAKAMLNNGGLLFLAVPTGHDALVWNAHRIYGRIRLPLLIAGWELVDYFGPNLQILQQKYLDPDGSQQPVFVLRPSPRENYTNICQRYFHTMQ